MHDMLEYIPEVKFFVFKLILHYPSRLHSGSEDILDGGYIAVVSYPLQTV